MPDEVITSLKQVTAEWLTHVLTNSGALTQGKVKAFDVESRQRELSTNARLNLRYADGSRGSMPGHLFLKMVDADMEDEFFGPSEVTYYTRDYVGLKGAPLVRCYDAAYSEDELRYHLLLDDLTETHVAASTKTPTLEYGLALAEGLAALHGRWWGRERLAKAGAKLPEAQQIRRFVDIAEPGAGHIIKHFSSELLAHWPDAIRSLYRRHPQAMIERTQDGNGFTLIHGDVGHNNILVPQCGDRPIYIIDRQPFDWSLTTWLGVYDLAYAMVLYWDVETRRRFEQPVLTHYYRHLIENNVRGYSWGRLWHDYRLSAALGVYVATEWCRGGINERWTAVWLTMLRRSMTAIDDLAASELWQEP
jgi:hypothetical protein